MPIDRLKTQKVSCPLCRHASCPLYVQAHAREYYSCPVCSLIFLDRHQLLTLKEERQRYLLHENNSNDPAYRKFLERLTEPLAKCLPPKSSGLDFGCGPGPTVSVLLAEHGHSVENYDPFFANRPELLNATYDFITATEVFEHLREPQNTLNQLVSMLNPSGQLAVMTQLTDAVNDFEKWHYPRDPTHINFFSAATMHWIAAIFNLNMQLCDHSVILLRK